MSHRIIHFFELSLIFVIACIVILRCTVVSGNFTSDDVNSPQGGRAQQVFESASGNITLSDVNRSPQGSRTQQIFSESPEGRREQGLYSLHLKTVMRISKRERSDKLKIRSQGSEFFSQMHMQLQMWLKSEGF